MANCINWVWASLDESKLSAGVEQDIGGGTIGASERGLSPTVVSCSSPLIDLCNCSDLETLQDEILFEQAVT